MRLTALRNEAASASEQVAGLGELNERLRWGLLAAGLRQKAGETGSCPNYTAFGKTMPKRSADSPSLPTANFQTKRMWKNWWLHRRAMSSEELCLATRLLGVAVGDFRRAQDTQRRWRQVAFQALKWGGFFASQLTLHHTHAILAQGPIL